jgi:hypothetical protein
MAGKIIIMTKISTYLKTFLESKRTLHKGKDQVIFRYKQAVDRKLVLDQVKFLVGNSKTSFPINVVSIDKENKAFQITTPGNHAWIDEIMSKGHNAPPMPVPHAPIFPEITKPLNFR